MDKSDLLININYKISDSEKSTITTNIKKQGLSEVLEAWLSSQLGAGKDTSEPVEKDSYLITITLRLEDDTFYTTSDTGNKSLTCGIVADVFARLDQTEVLPLETVSK